MTQLSFVTSHQVLVLKYYLYVEKSYQHGCAPRHMHETHDMSYFSLPHIPKIIRRHVFSKKQWKQVQWTT